MESIANRYPKLKHAVIVIFACRSSVEKKLLRIEKKIAKKKLDDVSDDVMTALYKERYELKRNVLVDEMYSMKEHGEKLCKPLIGS